MARIETYEQDDNLQLGDKWIGTDLTGNVTRNYSLESVVDFIVDSSTGNIVVNNPDEEDITVVAGKLKFKDRDASGFQQGYKIIRAGFDWSTAPASFANSIWEIRYEFDLLGAAVTLPDNVCLKFNGGFIKNYTSITALNGKSTVNEATGFDGSGTIDPTWVFGEIFDTDDRDKLDGIQAGATKSDLAYTPSSSIGTITNTGGSNSVIPVSTASESGLLQPLNILPNKATPVGSDLIIIEDSADSNSKKNITVSSLPVSSGVTNLAYVATPTDGTVTSDTGSNAILPAGSVNDASLMLPGDKIKLNNIQSDAEVNVQSDWNATSGDALILNKPLVLERIGATVPALVFTYPSTVVLQNLANILLPTFGTIIAICKVINNGYAVGARVQCSPFAHNYEAGGAPNTWGFFFEFTSLTDTTLRISDKPMYILSATTNQIVTVSSSEWNLEATVWGFRI